APAPHPARSAARPSKPATGPKLISFLESAARILPTLEQGARPDGGRTSPRLAALPAGLFIHALLVPRWSPEGPFSSLPILRSSPACLGLQSDEIRPTPPRFLGGVCLARRREPSPLPPPRPGSPWRPYCVPGCTFRGRRPAACFARIG